MPRIKRTWTPHPKQADILACDSRFLAIAAGRRGGKTFFGRNECFEFAFSNPDSYVWAVLPTDDDARELWFEPLLNEVIPRRYVADYRESSPRQIELSNGSRIQFRSAGSSSRGRGLDRVYLDEMREIDAGYWDEVIRPSLSDSGGDARVMSTPAGRDKFHDLFQRGDDPSYPEWSSFRWTTYENPEVDDGEVESARHTLPERVFRQEYLAEFQDEEGAVFPDPEECTRPYTLDMVSGTPPYSTGVDLARQSDYLAAVTLDSDGMVVDAHRDRGGSWAAAGRFLEQYLDGYEGVAYVDATRDNKVVEDLAREVGGVQVEPVRFTPQTKADLVENLAARLEIEDVVLPEAGDGDVVDALYSELRAFEYTTTNAGNVRYGAPDGKHDDMVDAFALAAKGTKQSSMTW